MLKKKIWVLTYLGDGGYPKDYFESWEFFSSFKKLKKYIKRYIFPKYWENHSSFKEFWEKEIIPGHIDIFTYEYHSIILNEGLKKC